MKLTELDSSIPSLSYPALERRLSSMRIAGLVEAQPKRQKEKKQKREKQKGGNKKRRKKEK